MVLTYFNINMNKRCNIWICNIWTHADEEKEFYYYHKIINYYLFEIKAIKFHYRNKLFDITVKSVLIIKLKNLLKINFFMYTFRDGFGDKFAASLIKIRIDLLL